MAIPIESSVNSLLKDDTLAKGYVLNFLPVSPEVELTISLDSHHFHKC